VQEYLADPELNASRAYVAAGYKAASSQIAVANASRLIVSDSVARVIALAQEKRAARVQLAADDVLRGLLRETEQEGDKVATARVRAWELLGKHLGMFVDRTSLEGPEGGPMAFVLMGGARQEQEALPEGDVTDET